MKSKDFTPFWGHNNIEIDKDQLSIVLLAHVQKPRGYINQAQLQCSETERFSIKEFNEIYQGIVNAGYYIQAVYYNEPMQKFDCQMKVITLRKVVKITCDNY